MDFQVFLILGKDFQINLSVDKVFIHGLLSICNLKVLGTLLSS